MAKYRKMACESCGGEILTARGNTKYCEICRMKKNLTFLKDSSTKCLVCEKLFAPLRRGEMVCLACDEDSTPKQVTGKCSFCEQDSARLLSSNVRVCVTCVQKTGAGREKLKAALTKKINAIRDGEIVIETPEIGDTDD